MNMKKVHHKLTAYANASYMVDQWLHWLFINEMYQDMYYEEKEI